MEIDLFMYFLIYVWNFCYLVLIWLSSMKCNLWAYFYMAHLRRNEPRLPAHPYIHRTPSRHSTNVTFKLPSGFVHLHTCVLFVCSNLVLPKYKEVLLKCLLSSCTWDYRKAVRSNQIDGTSAERSLNWPWLQISFLHPHGITSQLEQSLHMSLVFCEH